nr:hypothetical protein [Pandoravirus aubagnensis]
MRLFSTNRSATVPLSALFLFYFYFVVSLGSFIEIVFAIGTADAPLLAPFCRYRCRRRRCGRCRCCACARRRLLALCHGYQHAQKTVARQPCPRHRRGDPVRSAQNNTSPCVAPAGFPRRLPCLPQSNGPRWNPLLSTIIALLYDRVAACSRRNGSRDAARMYTASCPPGVARPALTSTRVRPNAMSPSPLMMTAFVVASLFWFTALATVPHAEAWRPYEMAHAPPSHNGLWEHDEPTLVDRLSGADKVRVPGADVLHALASHPAVRATGAPAVGAFLGDCALAAYTYLLVRPVAHIYHNAPGTEHWGMWFGAPPADMCARMTGGVSTASDWTANPSGCYAMIQRRFNGFLTMVHTLLALLVAARVFGVVRDGLLGVLRMVGAAGRWMVGRGPQGRGANAFEPPGHGCCHACHRLLSDNGTKGRHSAGAG